MEESIYFWLTVPEGEFKTGGRGMATGSQSMRLRDYIFNHKQ